jgi:hypothetical protein
MSNPRRRIIRPAPAPAQIEPNRQRRLQKARSRLLQEKAGLARWMSRLRRAFHAVEKCQRTVARLEHQITGLEKGTGP